LRRDYMLLWNTGKFDDITLETEEAPEGLIVRFILTERRVIRSIHYTGNKSVSESEILDRFKERKVGLTVEQQYDPGRVQHAAAVIKDYEAERGHQYATVDAQVEQQPPSSLALTFVVNEGPKVKVGEMNITGNNSPLRHSPLHHSGKRLRQDVRHRQARVRHRETAGSLPGQGLLSG